MKKNYKLICFYTLFLLLSNACTKQDKTNISTEGKALYTINTKSDSIKKIKYDTFINHLKFIKLETNENCLVGGGEIINVEIDNNLIFILDRNDRLFVFNRAGKFLRQIGRKGNGPKELLSINNFCLNKAKRQIALYDIYRSSIVLFNYEGKFIKRLISTNSYFNIKYFEFIDNNLLLDFFTTNNNPYNYGIYNIKSQSIENKFIPFLIKYNKPLMNKRLMQVIDPNVFKNSVLLTTYFSNILYKYDSKSRQIEKYLELISDKQKPVSTTTFSIDKSYDFREVSSFMYKNGYSRGIHRVFAVNEYLFLQFGSDMYKLDNILFNMKNHKSFELSWDNELLPLSDLINFSSAFVDNNICVKIFQSDYLIQNKEKYKKIDSLSRILNESNVEDNPIIILYDLKGLFEYAEKK